MKKVLHAVRCSFVIFIFANGVFDNKYSSNILMNVYFRNSDAYYKGKVIWNCAYQRRKSHIYMLDKRDTELFQINLNG